MRFMIIFVLDEQFLNNIKQTQNYIDLHNKFTRLRFKSGFDANRFISDFNKLVNDYQELGTNFPDEYIQTIFLQKIDGIHDHKSPFFSFFFFSFFPTITTYIAGRESNIQLCERAY